MRILIAEDEVGLAKGLKFLLEKNNFTVDIDVVWTYIGFVRKKLKSVGADVEIRTVRGAGYALEEQTC